MRHLILTTRAGWCPTALLSAATCLMAVEPPAPVTATIGCTPVAPVVSLVGSRQSVQGTPWAIDIRNHIVYLADWTSPSVYAGNFQTYYVLDPKAPVRLSSRASNAEVSDVAVSGSYVYSANDTEGISIYNVSNPRSCPLVSHRSDGQYTSTIAVRVNGLCQVDAFVGHHYNADGYKIYRFVESDPFKINAPTSYTSPNGADWYIDSAVTSTRAYVSETRSYSSDIWIEALDISRLPAVPSYLGKLTLPAATYGNIGKHCVSGGFLYLGASLDEPSGAQGGLRVIDVADPAAMHVEGQVDIADIGHIPWNGTGLALWDRNPVKYAFMVGRTQLQVIDITAPCAPFVAATAPLPAAFGPCLGGNLVIRNGYAYVAVYGDLDRGGFGGLAIYRIQ